MKIERYKSKAGGWAWRVDATIRGRRVREHGFETKEALEDFVAELRVQTRRQRFGLTVEAVPILVSG